jgi:hypothetical protein
VLFQKWQYQALARAETDDADQINIVKAWGRMGSGAPLDELFPLLVGPRDSKDTAEPAIKASIDPVFAPAPVLTPTFLMAALASSWEEGASLFGGWVFAGHKLYGLKLIVRDMRGPIQILEAHAMPLESRSDLVRGSTRGSSQELLISEERWSALPWANARRMFLTLDTRTLQVQRVAYKAPVIGEVELVLAGFTPG